MVKGRLPRESNPLPGDKSGFVASHDATGEEDYKRTSPLNPLPVTSIGDSNVKDAAVKAELELIKQGIADNKATNDLILARLDNPIDAQVTGSNVEEYIVMNDLDITAGNTITLSVEPESPSEYSLIVIPNKAGAYSVRVQEDMMKSTRAWFTGVEKKDISSGTGRFERRKVVGGSSRFRFIFENKSDETIGFDAYLTVWRG